MFSIWHGAICYFGTVYVSLSLSFLFTLLNLCLSSFRALPDRSTQPARLNLTGSLPPSLSRSSCTSSLANSSLRLFTGIGWLQSPTSCALPSTMRASSVATRHLLLRFFNQRSMDSTLRSSDRARPGLSFLFCRWSLCYLIRHGCCVRRYSSRRQRMLSCLGSRSSLTTSSTASLRSTVLNFPTTLPKRMSSSESATHTILSEPWTILPLMAKTCTCRSP